MRLDAKNAIESIMGAAPARMTALAGGCIGEVWRVTLEDGRDLVAKVGRENGHSGLAIEGRMLTYLAENSRLPVPGVHYAAADLLLIDYIPSGEAISAAAETHAAELLAALHDIGGAGFGLDFDTLIGGLGQPNPRSQDWRAFFRDHRLLHMAGAASRAGRLSNGLLARLTALAGDLDRWLPRESAPSLIHGDIWGGNVLCRQGRIAGFVDPAIYYADAEIELAFATLFATFGEAFFARYGELRPLKPGFFEERRDLYNLYPLLVHVRLFGGSYAGQVERTLARFGY